MLIDARNLLNRRTEELELMVKKLEDLDAQFGECMQQIKDAKQKQFEDLQKAVQEDSEHVMNNLPSHILVNISIYLVPLSLF
jgi:nanoRNase/pAp phosphatase (c-di-AMP/oligoRNAs hydrolase)